MKPEDRKQNQELWQERIKDWQQSGLSASAWCEQHNLKVTGQTVPRLPLIVQRCF